jgi:Ca-activated chloride channel family protein
MPFRWLLCLLCVVGLFTHVHAEDAHFRSGVELVPITVTVTDGRGRYVTDLRADDFSLSDNGVARRAELFERERAPVAMSIVLDSSTSMADRLPAVKDAVTGLLHSLDPADSAAIIDCDSTVRLLGSFSDDRSALRASLDMVTAGGTTALYDAVLRATSELDAVTTAGAGDARRGVIVVFSDGGDTSSTAGVDRVLARVQQIGAVVYTIALHRSDEPRLRGMAALLEKHSTSVLRQLAETTGGRMFAATSPAELTDVYRQIGQELTSQYILGFAPHVAGRGEWHRIAVGVRRTGTIVRARAAYMAPGL